MDIMFETKCVKVKLKPGSLLRVRAWADELKSRREEALETMREEGMVVESTFLDRTSEGDFLICFMKAQSFEKATGVVKQSLLRLMPLTKHSRRTRPHPSLNLNCLLTLTA
jgi:Family of unknown function (DUF6176)